MDNILYGVNNSDNRQLDLVEITVHNTVVASVKDSEDNTYYGDAVRIITDRDFLYVPDLDQSLTVGDEIYLDNQSRQKWTVRRGWYSVDDNPAIYGWYLESIPVGTIRSLFLKDFNSLTFVTPKTEFTLPQIIEPNTDPSNP